MPSLGADMEDGTLVEWLVKPGDIVKRGDAVAVVETQKGAIEIECFEEGMIRELKAAIGQKLPVGAPLAVIGGESAATGRAELSTPPEVAPPSAGPETIVPAESAGPGAAAAPAVPPAGAVIASPAARARAAEFRLDLGTVTGTGPKGVIVLGDVERAGAGDRSGRRTEPVFPTAAKSGETAVAPRPGMPTKEMRKAIAAAMTRSKQTIPHFYISQTIDVQPAVDILAARNAAVPPNQRLLLGAMFFRAAALAAVEVPSTNGHFEDGAFCPSRSVNPGLAIALRGGGLVAPALMNAPAMTLQETMAGMRDLVTRARTGRLRGSEMTAGTITVSSLGENGAEAMAGVIFPPQVALVGLGAPQLRPWVVGGEILPRMVVTLTLSVDHRVSDGRQATRFAAAFEKHLSNPEAL